MDTGWIVLVEGIAIFGLLIGFGVWQLRSLKKMEREDKAQAEAEGKTGESAFTRPRSSGSASDAGHPER
jgi:cytochrome oxidase assembly protein ShyY1